MQDIIYHHKILGEVKVTDACRELNKTNLDKTSTFVEYEDETREVTTALIEELCQIIIRTIDSGNNIIKENIIETNWDDQIIWKKSSGITTYISSGDTLNVKFKTDNAPGEHIEFHDKLVKVIKLSKEFEQAILVENLNKSYHSIWEFSWRKKP